MTNTIEIISQFGGEIVSHEDDLLINGLNSLHGAKLYCDSDHRMTMLAGIASLISEEESELMNVESVNISYPNLWNGSKNDSSSSNNGRKLLFYLVHLAWAKMQLSKPL